MTPLPLAIQVLLSAAVWIALVLDLRSRTIPNWLTVTAVVAGLGTNLFLFGIDGLVFGAKGMGVALAIYVPLFALRAMGAGDVKLMAAVGSMAGASNWLVIFVLTAILGGVIALVAMVSRGAVRRTLANLVYLLRELASFRAPFRTRPDLDIGHSSAVTLPHGVAIALGTTAFLLAAGG
jgi:prepilin peptidase CpaA